MFSLFKIFQEDKEFLASKRLRVDIHSHLLADIDDGSKSIEDSIDMISRLKGLGYEKLIITPHTMSDVYPNTKSDILKKFELLQNRIESKNISIKLDISSEYYLDENFLNILNSDEIIPINNKYILIETSYVNKPIDFEEIIFSIKLKGLIPILAHPERYRYIQELDNEYLRMKELGILFQININSLAGYYGKDAYSKVSFLINKGLVDFIGSDTHHIKHINILDKTIKNKKLWKKIFNKNIILNERLLNGI